MSVYKFVNKTDSIVAIGGGESGPLELYPYSTYITTSEHDPWFSAARQLSDGRTLDMYIDGALSNLTAIEISDRETSEPGGYMASYYIPYLYDNLEGVVIGMPSIPGIDSTAPSAARMFISDSSIAYNAMSIGTVVAGGGSNIVPVYFDGTDWRIG